MKKLNKRGFTIVELVVVIAVIAILAGVLIPSLSGIVKKANESKALQEAKNAWTATLADDLDGTNTTAVVNGKEVIVSHVNGSTTTLIKITANGEASVTKETATHKIESGKLVLAANEKNTEGTGGQAGE